MPLKPVYSLSNYVYANAYHHAEYILSDLAKVGVTETEVNCKWRMLFIKIWCSHYKNYYNSNYFNIFNKIGLESVLDNKPDCIEYTWIGKNGTVTWGVTSSEQVYIASTIEGESGLVYVYNNNELMRLLCDKLEAHVKLSIWYKMISRFVSLGAYKDQYDWFFDKKPFKDWDVYALRGH